MLNLVRLECKNFRPRKEIADSINSNLQHISEIAPSDATCIATIERMGRRFRFEINVYSMAGTFSRHIYHFMDAPEGRTRYWQAQVVQDLCLDMETLIHTWMRNRIFFHR